MLHRSLKDMLQQRLSRISSVGFRRYADECRYLLEFLRSEPYIQSTLAVLENSQSVDFFTWAFEFHSISNPSFPPTVEGRAKVCHGLLQLCVSHDTIDSYLHWGHSLGRRDNIDDYLSDFTEAVIEPLIEYLCERIDDGSNMLFLLEHFKNDCQWFRQEELYSLYIENSRTGEEKLLRELQRSLFAGGVEFPFSQPGSPSGKVDTIAGLRTRDPLVLEAKIFDPAMDKRMRNVRQGFHQVVRYAQDYNESIGYLVIFNCSDSELLIVPEAGSEPQNPTRVEYGGKNFFVVTVNVNPQRQTASKETVSNRVTCTHSDLTGMIGP